MRQPIPAALAALLLLTGLGACGASDDSTAAADGSPASTPSPTAPAHDLRITGELEAAVRHEWDTKLADPVDPAYRKGVTVKAVAYRKIPGGTRSDCTISFTRGPKVTWGYLVAPDGVKFTRAGLAE